MLGCTTPMRQNANTDARQRANANVPAFISIRGLTR
jgi:hypothetical protein